MWNILIFCHDPRDAFCAHPVYHRAICKYVRLGESLQTHSLLSPDVLCCCFICPNMRNDVWPTKITINFILGSVVKFTSILSVTLVHISAICVTNIRKFLFCFHCILKNKTPKIWNRTLKLHFISISNCIYEYLRYCYTILLSHLKSARNNMN